MTTIRLTRQGAPTRCALCHDGLSPQRVRACTSCRTAVHELCARTSACPTLGCRGRLLAPAPLVRAVRARRRLGARSSRRERLRAKPSRTLAPRLAAHGLAFGRTLPALAKGSLVLVGALLRAAVGCALCVSGALVPVAGAPAGFLLHLFAGGPLLGRFLESFQRSLTGWLNAQTAAEPAAVLLCAPIALALALVVGIGVLGLYLLGFVLVPQLGLMVGSCVGSVLARAGQRLLGTDRPGAA